MKKIVLIFLIATMCLSLCACTQKNNNELSNQSVFINSNESDTVSGDGTKDTNTSNAFSETNKMTNEKQKSDNAEKEDGNSSSPLSSQGNKTSQSSSKTELTYEDYEKLNENSPVRGNSEWKFHSTDTDYAAPNDPSELSECCITIDETDHVTMVWNYYYKAKNHPEFSVDGNESVKFDGTDYYWFLCYKYEGTCFVEQNGIVSIQLKCINDWGDYVNDEIVFMRDGADKLIVTSHTGTEFNLFKGDEFTR